MDQWEALNAKLTYEEHLQAQRDRGVDTEVGKVEEESKMVVVAKDGGREGADGDEDAEAKAQKEREFAKKRAAHYNEFKVIQAMRARMREEEEEEEDEEGGEEGGRG